MTANTTRTMKLGRVPLHVLDTSEAVRRLTHHARSRPGWTLGVISVNLDHVHHLRTGGRSCSRTVLR